MQCTIHPKTLTGLLDLCTRFTARNTTLQILTHVYIQTKMNTLLLRATDMEKYIEITTPAVVGVEGALTVDAKMLQDIVRSLDTEAISLEGNTTNNILTIKTQKDKFSIKGIAATEYVTLPDLQATQTIQIPAKMFATGVSKVEYAVVEKNFSPVFTGIFIHSKQEDNERKLVFVGTDSFMLVEYKIPVSNDINLGDKKINVIIPKSASLDMMNVANYCINQNTDITMDLLIGTNLIGCSFLVGDTSIRTTSILIQGTFPDYENEKIMPKTFLSTAQVDGRMLEKEIKKVGILAKDLKNFITLNFTNNTLYIDSGQTEKGDATTQMPITKTGEDATITVNGKYFCDFIKNMTSTNLHIGIVNNVAPVTLFSPDDMYYKAVIRPITKSQ